MAKILLIFFALPLLILGTGRTVGAFDLFSNCVKEQNGKTVCGPCAQTTNQDTPNCQQALKQGNNNPILKIINTAANIIALITGIAAVIMIIIGGLTMITSAGNTEAVTAARRRVLYAIVGLVVVALSWTIIRFITDTIIQ